MGHRAGTGARGSGRIGRSRRQVALLALAATLIVCGTAGTAFAIPQIRSRFFGAQVRLASIETALMENGTIVEGEDVLLTDLTGGEPLELGRSYQEVLSACNVGDIDQYVRVSVYRYWVRDSKEGTAKACDLDPSLIRIGFVEGDGWTIDRQATTPERTVLYYDRGKLPVGAETTPFVDSLAIDARVATLNGYKDARFVVEAQVDAVQTHNGERAKVGAWGKSGPNGSV